MAQKTGYRALKAAGRPLPLLQALFSSGLIYLAAGLAGVLAVTLVVFEGGRALARMEEPPVVRSDYLPVDPAATPAGRWAEAFVGTPPPNTTSWTASKSTQARELYPHATCDSLGLSLPEQYAAYSASGAEGSLLVQLYAPGTAPGAFEGYREKLSKCFKVKEAVSGSPQTVVYTWEGGFLYRQGDAVVGFASEKPELAATLLPWFLEKSSSSLLESGCKSLVGVPGDRVRNLYFAPESYEGLVLHDVVRTRVLLGEFPTAVLPDLDMVTAKSAPEGPLPEGFPQLPAAVARPKLAPEPQASGSGLEKEVAYQSPDLEGPGCGWEWSSTREPVVNSQKLREAKEEVYRQAQSEVDGNALALSAEKLAYSRSLLAVASAVEDWNRYAAEVAAVQGRWAWLTDERSKLRGPWESYVRAHDSWVNFDNSKHNAGRQYEAAVKACDEAGKALQEWHKTWDDVIAAPDPTATPTVVATTVTVTPTAPPGASPRPTPTVVSTTVTVTPSAPPRPTVPPPPEACTAPPPRPAILDQEKPEEPTPPTVPAGVTLPASWAKPITEPTVKREE